MGLCKPHKAEEWKSSVSHETNTAGFKIFHSNQNWDSESGETVMQDFWNFYQPGHHGDEGGEWVVFQSAWSKI